MCVNYEATSRQQLMDVFGVEAPAAEWRPEVWQDYQAPIIVAREGKREAWSAGYGLVPKDKQPPGARLTTMNARSETVGSLRSYRKPWSQGQLGLIPMTGFYEPNYETGKAVRWRISLADGNLLSKDDGRGCPIFR